MLVLPIFKTRVHGLLLLALVGFLLLVCSCLHVFADSYNLTVGTDSSVYQPGQQVCVSGRLTYNDWPQQNRLVTIWVCDPNSQQIVFPTLRTDVDGRYSYTFTLPLQAKLGTYTVDVRASVEIGAISNSTRAYVGIPGDVDGNNFVEIKDILAIALAYGSYPGEPRYNANLDINGDEFIDSKDILIAALNYGLQYP